ncbi:MerR family transcriptional regulator [Candidatus Thiothrix sp. Deng01]|uniref:MerR family transcriptional regulator n=1 Tax=Candidatus Thiothrix phosphatis TaxID=3112415 RepID=A0ABU6CSJ7_9GAMM|nr:MerR family transcriptional regulator [Candidatus Thiothrix sp. Deng01]MEB4589811.1 MerR family transcriptional regulator [Candidatus Thiothrix sp. Deng01]
MYTISQLAKRFGLSRSALLHYDAIGLLPASMRSASGYRLYTEQAVQRMTQIQAYRDAGLPLADIRTLLASSTDKPAAVLERHLQALNRDISRMRQQQQVLVRLLGSASALRGSRTMSKERWVEMLRAAGLDEAGMRTWHREFEQRSPEAHQDFLESLGIGAAEIALIREHSRQPA